jgi:DNA invertase Pin-like site-specific DNA recombinase
VVLPPITNIVTAIAYLRVSTQEQDRRGFGLGTQRAEIEQFARKEKLSILSWHEDIQTGAGSDALLLRPGLAAALKEAKARRCPLIVSRLDRLSRSVHFISGLMELRVHFMVAALGKLHDNLTLHIWASLAEQERKLISERVRAAAAIQKFRGVKMGQAGRTKEHQLRICALAHAGRQRAAMDRAEAHRPHIEWALRQPGIRARPISLHAAAQRLNARGIASPRGARWAGEQLMRMGRRLGLQHPAAGIQKTFKGKPPHPRWLLDGVPPKAMVKRVTPLLSR